MYTHSYYIYVSSLNHRHGTLVNIPLLLVLYAYWYKNKEHLLSLSSEVSPSSHLPVISSFNTTLETLRLSGYSELMSYLIPIIGERLPSILKEDDLKGVGLIFDTLVSRLNEIGLDYRHNQEKLYTLLTLFKIGGFIIESSLTGENRIDVIRLLKFCKEYIKRRESLTLETLSIIQTPRIYENSRESVSETLTRNQTAWTDKKPLQKMVASNQLEDHIKVVNGCVISSEAEDIQQKRRHHVDAHDFDGKEIHALLHQQQLELDLQNRMKMNMEQSPIRVIKPWMKSRDHHSPEKRHSRIDGSHSSVDYDITIPDPVSPSKLTDLVGMKVPEKRHVPSPLRLPKSAASVTTSNVFHRLKRTLPTLLDIEIKRFYHSLCKSAIASGSFLAKSAIPSCLLDIGIRVSHYDGELLWEDLTYGGRRLSITPEQCLELLGVTLSESTIAEIQNSLNAVREHDRMIKIMQSSPLRQSVGYDENDVAMLRLVQQDDEMRREIYSKLSSPRREGDVDGMYTSPARKDTWVTQDPTISEPIDILPVPPPLPLPSSTTHTNPTYQSVSSIASPSAVPPTQPPPPPVSVNAANLKIRNAISILANKKIDLALLYRRWGGSTLGCRGNLLVEMLLSSSLSLDLTREEAIFIVCEAGIHSYIHTHFSFDIIYVLDVFITLIVTYYECYRCYLR